MGGPTPSGNLCGAISCHGALSPCTQITGQFPVQTTAPFERPCAVSAALSHAYHGQLFLSSQGFIAYHGAMIDIDAFVARYALLIGVSLTAVSLFLIAWFA